LILYPPFNYTERVERVVNDFTIEQKNFLFVIESSHKADFTMQFHRHDFFELAFVTAGSGLSQRLEGGEVIEKAIMRDTILLWDGRLPHRAVDSREDPLRQIIMIFDSAYLQGMKNADTVVSNLKEKNPLIIHNHLLVEKLKPYLREILYETYTSSVGRESIMFACLSNILMHIIRDTRTNRTYTEALHDRRVRKAVEYIHKNYFLSLKLEDIAGICNLSTRHFSDIFKHETGRSFTQYIHWYRIQRAKEFLRNSSRSITDIAFEVGYDDVSYFTKRFKKEEKLTPREARLGGHAV
jgi:AraC-like DNA-binding protein